MPKSPIAHLIPQAAGEASPATLRAAATVRKRYPADMTGVTVGEDWDAPEAFSSTLATTPLALPDSIRALFAGIGGKPSDPNHIAVNPAVGMLWPEKETEAILAHELEHIRQNRTGDPGQRIQQHALPYNEQPDEIAAFKAGDEYNAKYGGAAPEDFNKTNSMLAGIRGLLVRKK